MSKALLLYSHSTDLLPDVNVTHSVQWSFLHDYTNSKENKIVSEMVQSHNHIHFIYSMNHTIDNGSYFTALVSWFCSVV